MAFVYMVMLVFLRVGHVICLKRLITEAFGSSEHGFKMLGLNGHHPNIESLQCCLHALG